jgi:transcriptional regulator with XRE-family HTH domain
MNPSNKKPLGERAHYVWQAARPELKEFVGHVIKQTRLARDQDVSEMAAELGIAITTIYRWERGDIGGAAAIMFYWLFKDHDGGNETMDPVYWRQRAILAEDALSRMSEAIYDHNEELEKMVGRNENGNRLSSRQRNHKSRI